MVKKAEIKLKKGKKQGQYLAESHEKGKFYTIDVNKGSCGCPHWMFRLIKIGGKCKHILAVEKKYKIKVKKRKSAKELEQKQKKKTTKSKPSKGKKKDIINYVSEKSEADVIELINKFGEENVDSLIEQGELIEKQGKVKIM